MMIEPITLNEMREMWPKDDSGRLCARLLQRYAFTLLVDTAAKSDCNPVSAPAETAANKALAKLVKDFGTLVTTPKTEPRKPMPTLNRFSNTQPTPAPTQ